MRIAWIVFLAIFFSLPLMAYVGPGAGFAFAGSFLFIFVAFFLAFFNLLTLPIRFLIRFFKRWKTLKNARFKRIVIIGFDGMDYQLFKDWQKKDQIFPHFEEISQKGTFAPLLSTEPPISPVAWSTFATGVNPGKHNIFDFLTTDRKTYMPKLSVSEIIPGQKTVRIGKILIPLTKPKIELKRKSQSFWHIASKNGVYSSVLRVPYTFPPEKIYGSMLSGLGTPDLRGTQGSFTYFVEVEDKANRFDIWEGSAEKLEKIADGKYLGKIKGPPNPFVVGNPHLQIPFTLTVNKKENQAELKIKNETITLKPNELTPWQSLKFKAGLVSVNGIGQWLLISLDPVRLYLSPINIDPASPSMPISHPKIFSVYLAKLLGPYATLGMAEDTTAVNEKILDEENFLTQVYNIQLEREAIFFDTLAKVKRGLIVQVFETTDRIQHMFWRYLPQSGSPAPKSGTKASLVNAIKESYRMMDEFLGKLLPCLNENDLLLIVSDHGFNAFNRGFHLNSWLHQQGYLVLKEGKTKSDKWYADVDWSKSRAYGQGLNGIYLNMKDREIHGIVQAGEEAEKIAAEIKEKLLAIVDPKTDRHPIAAVYQQQEIYKGPYTPNSPDLIVGYTIGYRVSWESAVNYVDDQILSDNTRMWSGDHAFTREQIPGIFFANRRIKFKNPSLLDIAPTVLSCLGIKTPGFIEGRDLEVQ